MSVGAERETYMWRETFLRGLRCVEDGNVLTGAGVTSGVSATLRVVRGHVGDEARSPTAQRHEGLSGRVRKASGVHGSAKPPDRAIEPIETHTFEEGAESMQRSTESDGTEPNRQAAPTAMVGAAEPVGTASPRTDGRLRGRFVPGWRFVRHLLEMVVAMMLGMGALGLAIGVLGEPPGYANLLVRYGLMGAFMAAPMVAWMRHRGHSWRDGGEMAAAMLLPMLAPVAPVEMGVAVPGLNEGSLMLISHVTMIGGMVALMLYRFERYAHGAHDRRS